MNRKNVCVYFLLILCGTLLGMLLNSSPAVASDPIVDELRKQVTELQSRLSALESAVKISGGQVTIQSSGKLSLKGAVITLNDGRPVAHDGDTCEVTCSGPGIKVTGLIQAKGSTVFAN